MTHWFAISTHACQETAREILIDLVANRKKREEVGRRSREFALKWHSSPEAARRFDEIYSGLLAERSQSARG